MAQVGLFGPAGLIAGPTSDAGCGVVLRPKTGQARKVIGRDASGRYWAQLCDHFGALDKAATPELVTDAWQAWLVSILDGKRT